MISIGIEQLALSPPSFLQGKKIALLSNQASTDRSFRHSREIVNRVLPGQLTCLFSPQHGFFSEKQDNMIESEHIFDPLTGLPIFSLYAASRKPDTAMFAEFDVLLVDLIDVGTRVYTFAWTVIYCLQTAAETGKKVVILDRPNPIGGHLVEGNLLKEEYISFVGLYTIPMRHGMTLGELALLCNREMGINADLYVLRVKGWHRNMYMTDDLFPWVFPSPNMPSLGAALVYPGQVIWEGTNVSEGRGTTLPFLLCGAPYIRHREVEQFCKKIPLPGCVLRPVVFEPTSGKWNSRACNGFHFHVINPDIFRPYRTSLALLQAICTLYRDHFAYKEPPYEYEFERLPMDLILGDQFVRKAVEAGEDILELERTWQDDLAEFAELRRSVLLYDGM
ncbi:MAG: exo-beta-N-acetylmuramidase NamZ family protein [Desulfobulbales bacterium]